MNVECSHFAACAGACRRWCDAAQALRENPAGVECCKLIAEKNSIQNPPGYLLAMLRNGNHRLTVEEQERSEVRDPSGIWWLCDGAQCL